MSLPPHVWAVVANVVWTRPYGPAGAERRTGTKHFAPGAKVVVGQRVVWGTDRRVLVFGRHRKSGRLISLVLPARLLANWRAARVYTPAVVRRLVEDQTSTPRQIAELREALAAGLHPGTLGVIVRDVVDTADDRRRQYAEWAAGEGGKVAAEGFAAWYGRYGAGSQPFVTRTPSA